MPSPSSPRHRAAPSSTGEGESPTPSQLDILAERNERFATPSLFARAVPALAVGAVALLLGALLWWVLQRAERPANASVAPPGAVKTAAPVEPDAAASSPGVTSTTANDVAGPETRPTSAAAPATAASAEPTLAQARPPARAPSATAAERARKAQVRRESDARANASRAPAPRQPREIDIAATPAADSTPIAAGPSAPGATASRPRAGAVAAGVREFCEGRGNIVSQLFCQSRECRKPDRATDPTCVRLKEIEASQRREPQ